MEIKKKFGNILVQQSSHWGGCGLVEMIVNGCVICYFESRDVDEVPTPELREVHDRLLSVSFEKDKFWQALVWGRKLSEVVIELEEEKWKLIGS